LGRLIFLRREVFLTTYLQTTNHAVKMLIRASIAKRTENRCSMKWTGTAAASYLCTRWKYF